MAPDNKPGTIDGLVVALQEAGFVYRCGVEVDEDEEKNPISRKLRQFGVRIETAQSCPTFRFRLVISNRWDE